MTTIKIQVSRMVMKNQWSQSTAIQKIGKASIGSKDLTRGVMKISMTRPLNRGGWRTLKKFSISTLIVFSSRRRGERRIASLSLARMGFILCWRGRKQVMIWVQKRCMSQLLFWRLTWSFDKNKRPYLKSWEFHWLNICKNPIKFIR